MRVSAAEEEERRRGREELLRLWREKNGGEEKGKEIERTYSDSSNGEGGRDGEEERGTHAAPVANLSELHAPVTIDEFLA